MRALTLDAILVTRDDPEIDREEIEMYWNGWAWIFPDQPINLLVISPQEEGEQ